jgi:hypothetical protein
VQTLAACNHDTFYTNPLGLVDRTTGTVWLASVVPHFACKRRGSATGNTVVVVLVVVVVVAAVVVVDNDDSGRTCAPRRLVI